MFENLAAVRALGLDERFIRMWEYYLCYCEGGFDERAIGVAQAVFEKPGARRASALGDLGRGVADCDEARPEARCA